MQGGPQACLIRLSVLAADIIVILADRQRGFPMKFLRGIVAGFGATIVLSVIMVMKGQMGIMPELNVAGMLSGMMNASLAMGWLAHFMIGTVIWGSLFALVENRLPGGAVMSGVVFSIFAWLLMMVGPMQMAGAGLFGLNLGVMAPMVTLMLHLIWGLVLGFTYERLPSFKPAED